MTIESVVAPPGVYCTPERSGPFVTPVAATKTSSPETRSSLPEHAARIEAGGEQLLPLVVVARPEPCLDAAADALQSGGRDDALRRAADPVEDVDAGVRLRRGDRRCDVAVADQLHARARVAELGDERVVTLALEDDHVDLAHRLPERLGDGLHVLRRALRDVDRIDGERADGDLLHVERRTREEHRAALRDGDHGDGAGLAERRQPRALERVDGDVDLRADPVADLLAVVEHRRLVLLPLADDDDAAHADAVEDEAHRVDRRLVGALLLPAADPPRRRHRARLRDADELHRDVAVRGGAGAHGLRAYILSGASTPTSCRQRAITICVARHSPSRNSCCSLSSTRCSW